MPQADSKLLIKGQIWNDILQITHRKSIFNRILRNTASGIFIGVEFAVILAWVFDSDLNDDITKLYTFLITASLSLFAAALTLVGVFASIENQQTIAQRSREKKLAAARAFLPSSLSKLCSICVYGMKYSFNFAYYEKQLGLEEFQIISLEQLSFSDEIISVFRDIIELTDRDDVTMRLSGLIREHQIFTARWESEFSDDRDQKVRNDSDIRLRTVSWAYLYAITVSIFEYARNEADVLDGIIGPDEITSALYTAGIPELHEENYHHEIGLYAKIFGRRF